ncbi:hypothetical protein EDB84DRAFT_453370 [Lactarius hengduanensis]|nr:hypothetical protein EDB84DRAFT_453370 [Lactarius hengduanensis]
MISTRLAARLRPRLARRLYSSNPATTPPAVSTEAKQQQAATVAQSPNRPATWSTSQHPRPAGQSARWSSSRASPSVSFTAARPSVTVALGPWDIQKYTLTWINPDLGRAVIGAFFVHTHQPFLTREPLSGLRYEQASHHWAQPLIA